MKLGIDIDGVLADFNRSYKPLIESQTGLKLPELSDSYPDTWYYDRAAGVTPEQEKKLWDTIKADTSFWSKIHPYPGTFEFLEALNKLRFEGHEIYFITVRPGTKVKYQTERWLSMSGMMSPTVLISATKDKGPIAKGLGLDAMIDDNPEYLGSLLLASPETKGYLLDAPYNRSYVGGIVNVETGVLHSWTRVKSVMEFLADVTSKSEVKAA